MKDILRAFLRSLRVQRNRRRLEREERYYRKAFLSRGLSIPEETEIRAQFARRFAGKKPKAKGDLHILSIYHNYNWEGPSFGSSLAAFGEVIASGLARPRSCRRQAAGRCRLEGSHEPRLAASGAGRGG